MTFKSALDIDCGLRYMYDTLDIISPCGRKMLLEGEMMTTKREIDFHYRRLNEIYDKDCTKIAHKLMCLKDIHTTLSRLENGTVLDDIELFEIKHCLILALDAAELLGKSGIEDCDFDVANVEKVLSILDPDGHRIDAFYIYDSYSEELSRLRKQISVTDDAEKLSELKFYEHEIEKSVRETLCKKLSPWASLLRDCLCRLVNIDIDVAKGFFDTIPKSIDEAALIDGATKNQVFWHIIMPMSKPIVVYTILTSFIAPWVDFIFVSVIMKDNYKIDLTY